jgi:biopolymer transport protein ExbB/TolQ
MSTAMLLTFWGARLILVLLAGLSLWSVAIMVDRRRFFSRLEQEGAFDEVLVALRAGEWEKVRSLLKDRNGVRASTLKVALEVGDAQPDQIERAVKSYLSGERVSMERGMTVLATLGSNAPFIGLLGTVLGIINAFGALAESQNNTTAVMAGISEALIATAVGLFVAIPAVISYNVFSRKMRLILVDCESLRDLYLSRKG